MKRNNFIIGGLLAIPSIVSAAVFKTKKKTLPTATAGNPVVHFEVGCVNLEKTTAFYTGLFGWAPTTVPYASMLNTQSSEGIQGHITALGHEPNNYVTFYIQVADIADTLSKIEKAGGKKIIGPFPLPDGGKFAWFKDPEGNMIGLSSKAVK